MREDKHFAYLELQFEYMLYEEPNFHIQKTVTNIHE